jgi:Transcriptional regulator containing PAS, AAA-type ATPase, and DNA-binding domains
MIDVYDLPPALRNVQHVPSFAATPVEDQVVAEKFASRSEKVTATGISPTDLEDLERVTIQRVFDQVRGDKTLAGKMLGISRATLYRKIKRYQIKAASASA